MEFYNIQKLLSYNSILNLVIGGRGIGKTFASKKFCLERFLKYKEQSIYLRRRETELQELDKEKFFTTELLSQVFDGFELLENKTSRGGSTIKFKYNGANEEQVFHLNSRRITLNKEVVFYLKALSTGIKLKGSEYDEVNTILFDEFLIDENDRNLRYLPNETEILFNFLSSVFRLRTNVRVLMLANATNINNPYFNYLRFNYNENNLKRYNYIKRYGAVIEFPPNKVFDTKKDNFNDNPFYKLIRDSKTFESNVNNKFHIKNDGNLKKIKEGKTRLYQIMVDIDKIFTIYSYDGIMYVEEGFDVNDKTFTFDIDLIEQDTIYLERSSPISRYIRNKFYSNQIYYSSIDVKFNFQYAIQRII